LIIFNYLAKKILGLTFLISSSLLILLIVSRAGHLFARAVENQYAPEIIGQLLMYQMIPLISTALPASFFLAGLIVLTRMYSEREMTALFATGFSMRRLVIYMQIIGVLLAAGVYAVEAHLRPWSISQTNQLYHLLSASTEFEFLKEQEFMELAASNQTIYIDNISVDRKTLNNIFIADGNSNSERIILAETGNIQVTKDGRYFVLQNVEILEGNVHDNSFTRSTANIFGFRLPDPTLKTYNRAGNMSFSELLENWDQSSMRSEFTWRLVYPLSMLVLAFWLIPLARTSPRTSALTKIIPAIIIFMVYTSLLSSIQSMVNKQTLPYYMAGWWLHVLMVLVAVMYFYIEPLRMKLFPKKSVDIKLRETS
jgi:lipopolysaccharide export system permease protein